MGSKERRFPRIPSQHTVLVAEVEGENLDRFTRTHTVGLGGCGFVSEHSLGKGAIVELMISIRPRAIQTRARVAYEAPRPDGGYDIGVEFLELEESQRWVLGELLGRHEVG